MAVNLALKLTIQADGTGLIQVTQQGARGLKDVADQAQRTANQLKTLGDSSRTVNGLTDSVSTLRSAVASIAVGALARNFVQTADAATGLRSKLGLVTSSVTELVALEKSLFDISQQSRGSYTALGQTYAQVARSTENLGISQTQLLSLTKSIAQAITISGGSATSANAALVQLSQGFASGTLRGEELNSVMEQTPRLAQAIADGLGISIGQLRAMGQAGELTAEKVVKALEKASASLESEFARVAITAEQGFTVAANSVTVLVDRINTATGATSTLASGLGIFAKAVDFIAADIEKLNTQGQIRAAADDVLRLDARATKLRNGLANGFFGAEFRGDLERTLTDLDAAKKRFNELDNPATASPSENFRRSEIKDQEVQVRRLNAAQQAAQDVIRELSGVNKDYQKDLSALHEAYKNGTLDINAYRDAVSELAKKNSKLDEQQAKSAADAKAIAEGRFAVTKAVAEQVAEIERNTLALFSKANEAAYARGTLDATAYYTERARLQTADLDLQEKALTAELVAAQAAANSASKTEDKARAQARVVEITTKLIELGRERLQVDGPEEIATREWEAYATAAEKRYQQAADGADALATELRNLEFEGTLIGQTAEAVRALMLVRAEEAAQELERQALVARGIDLDGQAAKKLQDQADTVRRIAQQKNTNAVAQQVADVAERIESNFRDSFLRLTEGGKGTWKAFTRSLFGTFKTEVADQIYKTFLKPFVVRVIGSFLGIEGSAANAGGANSLAGIASNLSSLNSAYKFLNGGYQQIAGYLGFGATAATGLGLSAAGTVAGGFATGLATTGLGAGVAGTGLGLSTGAAGLGLSAGSAGAGAIGAGIGTSAAATGAATGGAAATGSSLYASAAAAGPYVVAALAVLNALGVFRSKKIVDGGLQGELGGQVNDYALQRKGGTLFSGPSYRVLDQGVSAQNQALQDSYSAIRDTVAGMAEQLGLGNDAIKDFTVQLGNDLIHPDTRGFGIKTQGLSQEEIIAKIETALLSANDQLAQFALGTEKYTREGESASQTLARLVGSLNTVNGVFDSLGLSLIDVSKATPDAASNFIDRFGGADQFAQVAADFYQNFYTEQERTANTIAALTDAFGTLGLELPTSRDGLKALIQEQQRLNGATSPVVAELFKLSATFASVVPATADLSVGLAALGSGISGLLEKAGITLDGLGEIISGGLLGNAAAADIGTQLSDLVIGGIRNALADSYAQQISQIVIDGIITPMVTAAATGASVTGIITDEAINAITAKADAFAAAVSDPAFVSAMDRIREALGGVASAASRAATSVSGASAAIDNGPFAIGGSGAGGDAEAFGTAYNASVAGLAFVNPFKEEVSTQFLELTKTMVDAIKAAQDEINGVVSGGYQGAVDAILAKASELREQIRSGGFESTVRNQIVDANSGVAFAEYNRSLAERRRDTLGDPTGVFQAAVDRANEAIAQYRAQIEALNATLANGPDVQPYIDAQIALLNFRNELAAGDLLGGLQREIDRLGRTDLENRLADISEQSANYVRQLIELNQATPENIAAVQAWEAAMLAAAQSATTATNQINEALARNAQDLGDRFLNEQQLMAAQYQRIAQSLTDAFGGPADGVAALTATIRGLDRAGIQDAINGILAQTDATDAMKQAGIDAANGLLDLIEQQERLAAANNGVTEAVNDNSAALQLQEQIMAERLGLERQLLEAQGDTAALAALDREAINAANRGLYDQVIATRAAAAAQAELTAQRQREADQATGLQRQLLELQGDTAALAGLDREAIFGVNQGLYDLVQAARTAKEAEAALAAERERITQEGLGLERQLLQERGDSVALLALDRAEINAANLSRFDELQALKAYNTAIAGTKTAVSSISGILDSMKSAAAAAADKVTSTQQAITSAYLSAQDRVAAAQQRVGDEARQAAENMTGFASNIRDFVDSLDSTDAGGGSLLQQRAALESQFAIARAQATAGDPAAFARVTDLAGRLIANLQETSGSNLEFFRDQGLIKNQLSDLAALAAAQGTPTDPLAQIASASGELAAAQAELQRLSGIAAAAGAATSATVTDLLGEYQAARTAADAASADLASALDLTRNINLSQLSQLETLNQNVSAWLAAQAIVNAGTAPFAPAIAPTPSLVLLPIANGQAQGQADQSQNQSYAELLAELRAMRAKLDQIERHAAGTKDNTLKTADVLDSAQRGQPFLVAVVD